MKNIMIILLLSLTSSDAFAQSTPLYVCDTPTGAGVSPAMRPLGEYKRGMLNQHIYYQSDFPTMPAQGFITDVYWHIAHLTPKGTKLKGLTVKMKPTGKSGFPVSYGLNNEIETGLTTVYYDSLYVAQDTLYPGDWLRLTLPVPYPYSFISSGDSDRNLMVELSQDSTYDNLWQSYYLNVYSGGVLTNQTRYLEQGKDTALFPTKTSTGWLLVLGFNPKPDPPLGVDGHDKYKNWVVYPNPAKDRAYLPKKGTYQVYDMKGQQVLEVTIANDNTIDVSALPIGLYIIRTVEGNSVYRFTKE